MRRLPCKRSWAGTLGDVRWLIAVVACAACGRVGFDPADAVTIADHCATATFANPAASSFSDDFSSGMLGVNWSPVATCVTETGGELIATPPTTTGFCHAWTMGDVHLSCDSVTVHVPEVTAPLLRVQTYLYIYDLTTNTSTTLIVEAGGVAFIEPGNGFQYNETADAWWRISEQDGVLAFATAPDGTTWTQKATAAAPFSMDHVQIALGAGMYQQVTTMPGRARFHCYNLPPPCQ